MSIDQTSRLRLVASGLLALTFIGGASAGVIGDRLAPRGPIIQTKLVRDMSGVFDKLELTADQRAKAEAIVTRSGPRTEEVMIEMAERLRSVSDSVDADLRSILTPVQRARLDSMKRSPVFMLKKKTPGGSTTVDTLFPGKKDTKKHQ